MGGGISGLVCAWQLRRRGLTPRVLEATSELGGCMRTSRGDAVLFEHGPFNVVARDPAFTELLAECHNDAPLVALSNASRRRYLVRRGKLRPVPSGLISLLGTRLLSPWARLRLLRGLILSRRPSRKSKGPVDESIHDVAARRLGKGAADVLVSSIVAGVFGGDSEKTSLRAAFPTLADMDRTTRSPLLFMLRRMRAKRRAANGDSKSSSKRPTLISFKGGLQSLANWLGVQLAPHANLEQRVTGIAREGDDWVVTSASHGGGTQIRAAHVVLATPARVAGLLVRQLAPDAAHALVRMPTASLVVVNLLYARSEVEHPLDGYGFLVPSTESSPACLGVLFADAVFPHHAPEHQCVLRVFLGGTRDPDVLSRTDKELRRQARDSVETLLGIQADPRLAPVARWPRSIPQYVLDHLERVETVEREVARHPGLHLTGNYLRGVSINDCVRESSKLAKQIAESRSRNEEPEAP